MERKSEQLTVDRQLTELPTFREWLLAVVYFPVTLGRLANGIHRLSTEMKLLREAGYVGDIVEVWQDFNMGFYGFFNGEVRYKGNKNTLAKRS